MVGTFLHDTCMVNLGPRVTIQGEDIMTQS